MGVSTSKYVIIARNDEGDWKVENYQVSPHQLPETLPLNDPDKSVYKRLSFDEIK